MAQAETTISNERQRDIDAYCGNITSWNFSRGFVFDFEHKLGQEDYLILFLNNNKATVWICVALYLVVIFAGQRIMRNRPAFKLRRLLIVWNGSLALFSIFGTARTLPELWISLNNGFRYSLCCHMHGVPLVTWGFLFCISKVIEFGDTLFIIFRKQRLIFLHWFHHTTVLLMTWYTASDTQAFGRWFCSINFLVHSFMYTYYFIKILGYRPYKIIQMTITMLQIVQMIVGCTIAISTYIISKDNLPCQVDKFYIDISLFMYVTYFLLFGQFFYNAYLAPKGEKKRQ